MKIPTMYRELDPNQTATSTIPTHIPISAIRLVHPLTDPETGITRDVVVQSLTRGKVTWHRHASFRMWTRYITGLNIAVPWPDREPTIREDKPADTRRADVEAPTFMPTLLRPPMPSVVIDELRNRYSKFRTRHEQEFVERKEAEEAERRNSRKLTADMLTPLQEFNKQERDLRRARGAPVLSDDMLARIGEVIARNKADSLANAGLSEVPPTATTDAPLPSS
jgi:large subunit ribosomal protein L24